MRTHWTIDDGYSGKSRPQHFQIDDSELLECDTVDEALELAEECLKNDFESKVHQCWDTDLLRNSIHELFAANKKEA